MGKTFKKNNRTARFKVVAIEDDEKINLSIKNLRWSSSVDYEDDISNEVSDFLEEYLGNDDFEFNVVWR